jgi:hypothetical protein
LRSPRRKNPVNLMGSSLEGRGAIQFLRQQSVVLCGAMAERSDHCGGHSALLQIPTRLRPANAPASPGGGMLGDSTKFMSRAAGEQNPDLFRHASNQLAVIFAPSHGLAGVASRPFIRIFRSFLRDSFKSRYLNQDGLSLATFSGPAKSEYHGVSRAMLRCSPHQSHFAGADQAGTFICCLSLAPSHTASSHFCCGSRLVSLMQNSYLTRLVSL